MVGSVCFFPKAECAHLLRIACGEEPLVGGRTDAGLSLEAQLLIVDVVDEDDETRRSRFRYPLPAECGWGHLHAVSEKARQEAGSGKIQVLVLSQTLYGVDAHAIHGFFDCWCDASSLGFNKCCFLEPEASLFVLDAVCATLGRARWERLFIFEAMKLEKDFGDPLQEERKDVRSRRFVEKVNSLIEVFVSQPSPLWRCDCPSGAWYATQDQGLGQCFQAALDVRGCARLIISNKKPYRFFWSRLLIVERRWLNRMRLLSDVTVTAQEALDDSAQHVMTRCVRLWLRAVSLYSQSSWLRELLDEVESGILGLLAMSKIMPQLPSAIRRELTPYYKHFPLVWKALGEEDVGTAARSCVRPAVRKGKGRGRR